MSAPFIAAKRGAEIPEEQAGCAGCAANILAFVQQKHGPAAGNTLLIAIDLWVYTLRPSAQASAFRAIAESCLSAARDLEAAEAGDMMPPAQGSA